MAEPAFDTPPGVTPAPRRTALGRQVREVLGHLHEPAYLEVHPLAAALHAAGLASGSQPLRAALTRLIDRLCPTGAGGARAQRAHQVLHLRYVEGLAIAEVCGRLAISESEYYRSHRQGLDALVSLVSGLGGHPAPAGPGTGDRAPQADLLPNRVPLVGRSDEYAQLVRRFGEVAATGAGELTFVVGPAGVGKTRLVTELGHHVQHTGGLFLSGACPREGLQPHDPWIEPLQQALTPLSARDLTEVLGPYAAHLGRLLPELRGRLDPAEPHGRDQRGDRRGLFDGVVRVLTHVSRHTPILLLLDDLQWAASLALLQHVAQHLQHCRVLVIAAYREDELQERPQLAHALPDLHRAGWHHQLHLPPLSDVDTRHLLVSYLGPDLAARLAPQVQRLSHGNPFYVEEVLWAMVDRGHLHRVGDGWELAPDYVVSQPASLHTLLVERVTRLGQSVTEVLTQAAVLGPIVQFADLQAVTGLAEAALVPVIERALTARLLVDRSTDTEEAYAFADPAVAAALCASIGSPRRRRLQERIAAMLQTRHAGEAADALLAGVC